MHYSWSENGPMDPGFLSLFGPFCSNSLLNQPSAEYKQPKYLDSETSTLYFYRLFEILETISWGLEIPIQSQIYLIGDFQRKRKSVFVEKSRSPFSLIYRLTHD